MFLSSQMADYGGGAGGIMDLAKRSETGDTVLTPYLKDVLGEAGIKESADSNVIRRLKNLSPDSISGSQAAKGATTTSIGATRNLAPDQIANSAKSFVDKAGKTLKGAGAIAGVAAGAYAVSHFFRKDPISPEDLPQADKSPDVNGKYDMNKYKIERERQQEREQQKKQAEQRERGNRKVNTESNQAYIQNNGAGKNIKISGKGNVDTERIASVIEQQASQRGSEANINMNIRDNTDNIDNAWMQQRVSEAINDGYTH